MSSFATFERIVTQTISMTSTHSSFRSSGTRCENEMQCTKGQKRHELRSAGHDVALTSFQTSRGSRSANVPMRKE